MLFIFTVFKDKNLLYISAFKYKNFLGAFAKLRKATVSFLMSVRPVDCLPTLNKSAPTRRIFMQFDIGLFFENLWRKFKFL